ncbi:uncharacterized protein LOC144709570 [Wolffia australiana]
MEEKEVVRRFLRATPSKFDALALSLEQYGDLDKVSLDEVIGFLTVHELRLRDRESREEEQALLSKALSKTKIANDEEDSSCDRGRHRSRGRGRGRGQGRNSFSDDREKKFFDKSHIQCYNCQRYGYFAYECRSARKEREDRAYVVESTPTATNSAAEAAGASSLLMAIEEASTEILLQGSDTTHQHSDLWYLDTGATSHVTGNRIFFAHLDESEEGFVKFGDGSRIEIQGKGIITVLRKDGHNICFRDVLFVPKLCANILSLGRLDEEGYKVIMHQTALTIYDQDDTLLARVHRTHGHLYLLQLQVTEGCLLSQDNDDSCQLWHLRCFDPVKGTVHISRDVVFEEDAKWDWKNKGETIPELTFLPVISAISTDGEPNHSEVQVFEDISQTHQYSPSQSSESEQNHPERFKSITQLYDETSPLNSGEEECMVSAEEPVTFAEACREEAWRLAMIEEMKAIDRNSTWELVAPPEGCRPIGLEWIFIIKKNAAGEALRHKARQVVKGYSQKAGIDYDEVFAPVIRFESIRVLIAIAAQRGWLLHHLDVKSAFLNGDVKEELYVNQPEGFSVKGKEGHVLKLKKEKQVQTSNISEDQ